MSNYHRNETEKLSDISSDNPYLLLVLCTAGSRPEITTKEENIMAIYGEKEVSIGVGGNLTTVVGTDVKILCPVTALPNATITWLFNGSSVKEENRRLIKNGGVSLTGVIPEHVGSYTCVAGNSYGSASKTTMLSLISKRPCFLSVDSGT